MKKLAIVAGAIIALSATHLLAQDVVVKFNNQVVEVSPGVKKAFQLVHGIYAQLTAAEAETCEDPASGRKTVISIR